MKGALLYLAGVVAVASAEYTSSSSYVSCGDSKLSGVTCKVYFTDPKNNDIIRRCKARADSTESCTAKYCCATYVPPTLPDPSSFIKCKDYTACDSGYAQDRCKPKQGSTMACSTKYCCKPASSFVPCDSEVDCKYGYKNDRCKPRDGSTQSCTSDYCCKPAPKPDPVPTFVKCSDKYKCPNGFKNDRCKPRQSSSEACSEDYCCKSGYVPPPPPPKDLVTCKDAGVTCAKYAVDAKTGGIQRCKPNYAGTDRPCTTGYCCAY